MHEFERRIGRRTLGNKAASGTEIIKELGAEHMRTGSPIVYTSADSVFQIAAHEEVIPLWELYKICETAREILRGPHEVGRVIARPFAGTRRAVSRARPIATITRCRRPRACCSISSTIAGCRSTASARSSTSSWAAASAIHEDEEQCRRHGEDAGGHAAMRTAGLIFVNLVDFDQQYGHRNDVEGYGAALEAVRRVAARIREPRCGDGDLAIFTADHGCDPTTPSTDHSREYVPLLVMRPARYAPAWISACAARCSDIGQTVAANFGARLAQGKSFLPQIL